MFIWVGTGQATQSFLPCYSQTLLLADLLKTIFYCGFKIPTKNLRKQKTLAKPVVVKGTAGPFPKRARLASISTRSSSRALATLKDGALASPETERTGPLPSQQNDLDLTWDQDLDRSFTSEKDYDPDLILDHDLNRSASRNGIIIEMLPAYIARRIQPISSVSQMS